MARQTADPARNVESDLHERLLELDRLEELIEEMDELGIASRAEAEARLAELHRRVDEIPDE